MKKYLFLILAFISIIAFGDEILIGPGVTTLNKLDGDLILKKGINIAITNTNTNEITISVADGITKGWVRSLHHVPFTNDMDRNWTAITIGNRLDDGSHKLVGVDSIVHGSNNIAIGRYSRADGINTIAIGAGAHTEGLNYTINPSSPLFVSGTAGDNRILLEDYNQRLPVGEFNNTVIAIADEYYIIDYIQQEESRPVNYWAIVHPNIRNTFSHKEAVVYHGRAQGDYSHSEGYATRAIGAFSHSEGITSEAHGGSSHAEGNNTFAYGNYSHSEGSTSEAHGGSSHAEGNNTFAYGNYSHSEGITSEAHGGSSHSEGVDTRANGVGSHAEGNVTQANGDYSHSEGYATRAIGAFSHSEGSTNEAHGVSSHAEGNNTFAYGDYSHSEGSTSEAHGVSSHAEGDNTFAYGNYSHSDGQLTRANGNYSHSEGVDTRANGVGSHAEGYDTIASGDYSHAEGIHSEASNDFSFTWSGLDFGSTNKYYSHGSGTFNINPVEGLCGFYIGESNLCSILDNMHVEGEYVPYIKDNYDGQENITNTAVMLRPRNESESANELPVPHKDSFTFTGSDLDYTSHGVGTFNINPIGSNDYCDYGLYIGNENFHEIINSAYIDPWIITEYRLKKRISGSRADGEVTMTSCFAFDLVTNITDLQQDGLIESPNDIYVVMGSADGENVEMHRIFMSSIKTEQTQNIGLAPIGTNGRTIPYKKGEKKIAPPDEMVQDNIFKVNWDTNYHTFTLELYIKTNDTLQSTEKYLYEGPGGKNKDGIALTNAAASIPSYTNTWVVSEFYTGTNANKANGAYLNTCENGQTNSYFLAYLRSANVFSKYTNNNVASPVQLYKLKSYLNNIRITLSKRYTVTYDGDDVTIQPEISGLPDNVGTYKWSVKDKNGSPVDGLDGSTNKDLVVPSTTPIGNYTVQITVTDEYGRTASSIGAILNVVAPSERIYEFSTDHRAVQILDLSIHDSPSDVNWLKPENKRNQFATLYCKLKVSDIPNNYNTTETVLNLDKDVIQDNKWNWIQLESYPGSVKFHVINQWVEEDEEDVSGTSGESTETDE